MRYPALEAIFPGLVDADYEKTSCVDRMYNCIAWAAEDRTRFWWPQRSQEDAYWPGSIFDNSVAAFEQGFSMLGYQSCGMNDAVEEGYQKVAIFATDGQVQHMARQLLPEGDWTSKCGQNIDIRHPLRSMESIKYGRVVLILRRPLPLQGRQ